MSDTQTCPRRTMEFGPWEREPGLDTWKRSHLAEGGRVCSFCGGLDPDEFLTRVERGEEIITTDKNYKVYVGPDHQKCYFQHFDQEQRERFIELLNAGIITFAGGFGFNPLPFFMRVVG